MYKFVGLLIIILCTGVLSFHFPKFSSIKVSTLSKTACFLRYGAKKAPLDFTVGDYLINEDIRHREVRVIIIGDEGQDIMIGVLPTDVALTQAKTTNKDLVLINANANPPLCKIVEYSKFKYMMGKQLREQARKNKQSQIKLKELKMTYKVDVHDIEVRVKAARQFILDGDKVRFTIDFRGREQAFMDLGFKLCNEIIAKLSDIVTVEQSPNIDTRSVSMILSPKKK